MVGNQLDEALTIIRLLCEITLDKEIMPGTELRQTITDLELHIWEKRNGWLEDA